MQSQIIISPRGKLMGMIPHYLLVNGQLLGIIKGGEVRVNLPSGIYHVTIRSMYKFIESTVEVYVPINEIKRLAFSDRDKWWNWLFNIDFVLWIIKRLIHVPEPWGTIYEVLSNGFFAVWLLRIWIIRKRYFKITEENQKDETNRNNQ
jgi:hypothetical protein